LTTWSRSDIGFMLALVVGLSVAMPGTVLAEHPAAPRVVRPASPRAAGTFARLAEAVKPAVINVSSDGNGSTRWRVQDLFGRRPEPRPRSLGSGVIIDPSGVALTNAHVVQGAARIEVTMLDGTRYPAKLVGVDTKADVAVLRLQADGTTFPFLSLGDSDAVQVGEWVIAVGSPFGLQATVTSGIVSAKARGSGGGPYHGFLQTDAAINPGNAGGPLVNMRGEIIGINTAIVRGGSGIGLAIPANLARRILGSS
jgi:serine protease Do